MISHPTLRDPPFRFVLIIIILFNAALISAAPRFNSVIKSGNELRFDLSGLSPASYSLETSSNLVNWIESKTFEATGATYSLTHPFDSANRALFFRLVLKNTGGDSLAPIWPAGSFLSTQRAANGMVNLSWPAATDDTGVSSYNLYYQGKPLTNLPPAIRTFAMEGLSPVPTNHLFRIEAVDASGKKSTNRVALSAMVTLENQPPAPLRDFASATTGFPTVIDLLANDRDEDGDPVAVSSVTQPANGSVTLQDNRAIYTPNPGFSGRDVFYYTVSDQPAGVIGRMGAPPANRAKVIVHVAALVAYIVDTTFETNEFTELTPALAWLSENLLPNQAGKIVVKTRRALAVSSLNFGRDTYITRDEEGEINLDGNAVNITATSSLSVQGAIFTAPGGLSFNVSGYFDLIDNVFQSPLTTINQAGSALRMSAAMPPLLDVNLQSNEYQNLKGTLDVEGGGDIDIANGQGLTLELDARLRAEGHLGIKFEKVGSIKAEATLDGTSSAQFHGLNQLNELDGTIHATGRNNLSMQNTISGRLKLNVDDVGEVVAEATGTRTDNAEYNVSCQKFTHTGRGSLYGRLTFKGDGAAAFTPNIDFAENGARFSLQTSADFADKVKGTFGASYSTFENTLTLSALGEFDTTLGFVDVHGAFGLTAQGGPDGSSDAGASLHRVTFNQQATFGAFERSLFYVKAEETLFDRDPRFVGDTSVTAGVDLFKIFLGDGSRSGGSRRANILMDFASSGVPPSPTPGDSAGGFRTQAAPPELNIREVQLVGNPPTSIFDPPVIAIYGGKSAVNIESNRLDRAAWILVNEVQAPVTIRKNTVTGKGISLDGDVEGSGISGLRSEKYLVEENTITLEGLGGTALTIQDLRDVVIRNNTINLSNPGAIALNLSSAKAQYISNNIVTSLDPVEFVSLLVARGPGGPALLNASGNNLFGNIQLGPSGFAQFNDNSFQKANILAFVNSFVRLNNNDLAESQVDLLNQGYGEMIGNRFTAGSSINTGLGAYAVIQNNQFSETSIDIGFQSSARMSGNAFSQSTVSDDLPGGGFVLSPATANSGLDPENDIFSIGDWNGNGCADFPPDCDIKEDGMCHCEGAQPASDGVLPPLPQF